MSLLERIEHRFQWIAIPGLFKYLALFGVVIFACQFINPELPALLVFDRAAILNGEVWRIFTFALSPQGYFSFDVIGVLFMYFAVMIAFLVNDSLEQLWGAARLTLYILVGWLGLVGIQFLAGAFSAAGSLLYLSTFLAFATNFPNVEFRLFLFLPVQVRWIAWMLFAILVFSAMQAPGLFIFIIPGLLPYAIWVLPGFIRNRKNLAKAGVRRREYELKSTPEDDAFHRCKECNRTEKTHPDLDFRTLLDGTEYCVDHLPPDDSK